MRVRIAIGLAVAAAAGSTCGARVPKPQNLTPGTPYVSWVFMSGDRENPDRDFVCQSDPRNDCVIDASRPDAPTYSDLHFYYRGTGGETRYDGTVTVGFFEGAAAARTVQTSVLVKKDEPIGNQSVTGIVTSRTGRYDVTFALTATSGSTGTRQPLRQSVQVVVQ
ncbi:MAG TPA: hypothetical protein VKE51_42710 [Vicinamibacterales bacterium]|nr:hypothetical protein [Vicinamibacterales bacterium]